jgi:hypothetical protein
MGGNWIRIPSFFLLGSIWFALYRSGTVEFKERLDMTDLVPQGAIES